MGCFGLIIEAFLLENPIYGGFVRVESPLLYKLQKFSGGLELLYIN